MQKADEAVATFNKGFNCAQSVISVFTDDLGIDRKTAQRIASGFGGGIAHMGETCGAVTGAIMVISLGNGMSIQDNPFESNVKVYAIANKFIKGFVERYGSVRCKDLLGCDISNHDTLIDARNKGLSHSVCPKFVSDAVEIAESIIYTNKLKP
jgi:C_GCAxxG_C_C family probable redox protein